MIDKEIKNKKDCSGCHACMSICPKGCITMTHDNEGFLYPKVNYNLCIKCKKCIDVCPVINKPKTNETPQAYACINKDEETRLKSSSGGIFTLLADLVLQEEGAVFGAAFNSQFELEHICIDNSNIHDLDKLRGSKYLQSRIGNAYIEAENKLKTGKPVLFTGTPCQIAGLRSYLNKQNRVDIEYKENKEKNESKEKEGNIGNKGNNEKERNKEGYEEKKEYANLITMDFVCHGVPSPKVWDIYRKFREDKEQTKTQIVNFRYKKEGWKKFSMFFKFDNDNEYTNNLEKDIYLKAFLKDLCLRPSCYDCKFKGLNRYSDITLADFWGVAKELPDMDDDSGTSLVFVNSVNGQEIFDKIKDDMIFKEANIQSAIKYNPAAIRSAKYNKDRDMFMRQISSIPFDELTDKYCNESVLVNFVKRVKGVLKMFF